MSDMDKSQLDAAIRKEMMGQGEEGTNSETETSTETEEAGDAQPEAEEAPKEEPKSEEKRRSNVPKILRERNELRQKVKELEGKLSSRPEASEQDDPTDIDARIAAAMDERFAKQETNSFFESNPDAKAKKKAIESLMDDHGMTASDAWLLYQAKNDPKSLTKNATKALSTPSVPNFGARRDKTFGQLNAADQKSALKTMFGKGEISF